MSLPAVESGTLSWTAGEVDAIVSEPVGGVMTLESDGAALK